jgi:chromosome partitioning protein
MILAAKASAPFVIRKLLEQIKDKYDYIIIDCPPAKNQLTVAALVAADKVIIPTEPEYFAADGVTLMLSDIIQDVKDNYNPNLKVEGFLIVKYKSRFKENLYIVELLETIAREIFNTKVFETKIRDTVAIPTSQREGKNIFEFDRNCNASQDYLRLIREMTAA